MGPPLYGSNGRFRIASAGEHTPTQRVCRARRRSLALLDSNAAAVGIVLSPVDVAQLDALFPLDAAVGERCNEQMAQWVDHTTA